MPNNDRWNLSTLFKDDPEFYKSLEDFPAKLEKFKSLEASFSLEAPKVKEILDLYYGVEQFLENVSCYAMLRLSEDVSQRASKELYAKVSHVRTQWGGATAFLFPSLTEASEEVLASLIANPLLETYKVTLEDVLRYKAHTLTTAEEKLLALQAPVAGAGSSIFSQLTNADFVFGTVKDPSGKEMPLTQGSFGVLLEHPNPEFRERVYKQFYELFKTHQNTLCETFNTSLKQNWFTTQARKYTGTQERALFSDAVPSSVYANLIKNVRNLLPELHEYYALKTKAQGKAKISHADVYVPFAHLDWHIDYEGAVNTITQALAPLGKDYQETLEKGLLGGWVDRYERAGKRSGAFSSGTYTSSPYILMNYKDSSLRDVYTLAHEAGHSMHTLFSAGNNPFPHYRYAIFEAEVASTFNEQLLTNYLLGKVKDEDEKLFILAKNLDDLVATFFRQTMFAEFEERVHADIAKGITQTPESLREIYSALQKDYFGDAVTFFDESWLECLRIPHFYSPFYVYQYATGIASSIQLSEQVLSSGKADFYFDFLKRGGSVHPFDSLKMAGVDLSTSDPILAVGKVFRERLGLFKELLK